MASSLNSTASGDANAWPLYDMFDFSAPTNTTRSSDLAAAPIDEARRTECRMSGL